MTDCLHAVCVFGLALVAVACSPKVKVFVACLGVRSRSRVIHLQSIINSVTL